MTSGIYPWTMPQKFTFLVFPLHFLLYTNKVKKIQRPSALLFGHNRMYLQYFRTFDLSDIPECFLEAPVGMCSAHQPQCAAGRGRTWGGRGKRHVSSTLEASLDVLPPLQKLVSIFKMPSMEKFTCHSS